MSDLRIGLVTFEALRPSFLPDLTTLALGAVDHVGTIDHVSFHGGEGIDGIVTATALAARVPDLPVYVGVYLLPLRHPVTVARQLATLAQLAPGRIIFGVGIGGEDRHEVEVCGVDPRTRGRRMDSSLRILRSLLAGETTSCDDAFHRFTDARILPAPSPAIPIVVGGRSDAALRRTALLGDGWIGVFNSARRFAEATALVRELADGAGRELAEWHHTMEIWCSFGDTREGGRDALARTMSSFYRLPFEPFERYCAFGAPEHVAEYLAPYVQAGCRLVNLIPCGRLGAAAEGVAEVKQILARWGVGA